MTSGALVVNAGSSSLKYQLLAVDGDTVVVEARGLVERIGEAEGHHHHEAGATVLDRVAAVPDMAAALALVVEALASSGGALPGRVDVVGHRVVHGGERFVEPTLLTPAVVEEIRALVPLAPLHNPANLAGIEAMLAALPEVPQVAVFDTAFHRTLPPEAFLYALPYDLYEHAGVRRYGFHGTSHAYVARRAAALLGRPLGELAMVTLHLGNGCSACAVDGGRSVETSMGFTPLEGLVMGTRSGDVDPGVVLHLARSQGLDADGLDALLNHRSGLAGLCGDNDLRAIGARAAAGDERAALARRVFAHRVRKYVGAYAAVLGRLDAVVLTGGIGEHDAVVRALALDGLGVLGIDLDPAANEAATTGERRISRGPVAVLVVPTDEEREIAEQALAVVSARA